MKKLALSLVSAALLAGCQTIPVTSSNPAANQSRTGEPGLVSFGLQSVDFEYAASKAVQEFLESPFSKKPGGGRWVVQMGEVVNDTTFHIDTASMTSRMKIAMTRTGQFIFTGATGRDRTDFVADARQLSKSRMFDQKTVARNGTVVAADLEMLGAIRQRTVVGADQRQQQLEYEFDFRVVERDTGLEIFQSFIPIEKLGSNKSFAW
jgi:Collagen-binding surface adhesin SpaP (antigen I/II family)